MEQLTGFSLVLMAGVFQGLFMLPSTLTKNWVWEHNWVLFSFFGMFVFNAIIGFVFIPGILDIYRATPAGNIVFLMAFGVLCGAGSILFGISMDRLGMALGYPIIMGVNAGAGALLPLLIFNPQSFISLKGILVFSGVLIIIVGIVFCGKANSSREKAVTTSAKHSEKHFTAILIAVAAGILSCSPNIAMVLSRDLIRVTISSGIPEANAGNVVWLLFFSCGATINVGYCIYLIIRNKNYKTFVRNFNTKNLLLIFVMSIFWISSLYLYGISAGKLGSWGVVIGWALFISMSIFIGNLAGIWRGEWKNSPENSRRLLNIGLLILIVAIFIISFSNTV